jgi:hypothetical protein
MLKKARKKAPTKSECFGANYIINIIQREFEQPQQRELLR